MVDRLAGEPFTGHSAAILLWYGKDCSNQQRSLNPHEYTNSCILVNLQIFATACAANRKLSLFVMDLQLNLLVFLGLTCPGTAAWAFAF